MTEIISGLWIYSTQQANKIKNLEKFPMNFNVSFETLDTKKLFQHVLIQLPKIHSCLVNQKIVIVHSNSAGYMAPFLVACYLIKYGNMTVGDALNSIKSKMESAFEDKIHFSEILEALENKNI